MWFLFLKYFLCVKWFSYKTDLDRNNKPWYSLSKMKTKIKNKKERKITDKQTNKKKIKLDKNLKPSSESNWIKSLHKNQILKEELTKWVSQVLKHSQGIWGFPYFFFSLDFCALKLRFGKAPWLVRKIMSPWHGGSLHRDSQGQHHHLVQDQIVK